MAELPEIVGVSNEMRDDVFEYLDELRVSGVTNMFGAPMYVEQEFEVDRSTAKKLVGVWMTTFSTRHPS